MEKNSTEGLAILAIITVLVIAGYVLWVIYKGTEPLE